MTDQAHVYDDIPAYALGVLDPSDCERVESHLSGCSTCQKELRAYQEVVTAVALSAPQVQPPDSLKQSILQAAMPVSRKPAAEKSPARPGWWSFLTGWLRPTPALGFAAVLVVILLTSNVLLWNQVNTLSAMQRHGYSSLILNGTTNAPAARGMIVYTMDGKSGFLVVNGLQSLPSSKQYQLWLIKSGQRTNGGVFSVGEDGYAVMEVESSILLTGYDSFGITVEPAGGSPGPTGDKVMGGKF